MGRLCGVWDPLVWGRLLPITAALGACISVSWMFLGPLVLLFIYIIVYIAIF
ncbi:PTS system mannose/fructose/sorbose family transporter subunit IID [Escherichia coli]|uniref:PTS system mannose/fructose/sorbose family transporter subunit IID n=1 Tax=Escherichia coli TaxID=562 RepID=UPI0034D96227